MRRPGEFGRGRGEGKEGGQSIHTPIIAFTAGAMENKESSPSGGIFDDWVYKPFREEEIFGKLEKHLGVKFVYQAADSSGTMEKAPREREVTTPSSCRNCRRIGSMNFPEN